MIPFFLHEPKSILSCKLYWNTCRLLLPLRATVWKNVAVDHGWLQKASSSPRQKKWNCSSTYSAYKLHGALCTSESSTFLAQPSPTLQIDTSPTQSSAASLAKTPSCIFDKISWLFQVLQKVATWLRKVCQCLRGGENPSKRWRST